MKKSWCILSLLLALVVSCNKPGSESVVVKPQSLPFALSDTLLRIDSLMQSSPDSALQTLLSCHSEYEVRGTSSDINAHYQALLTSEALYKTDNVQSNRTELQAAMHYFDSLALRYPNNDDITMLSARSHYMNGVGYYEGENVVEACTEYLRTLDIMESHFDVEKLTDYKAKFMGLTYTRLGEMFFNYGGAATAATNSVIAQTQNNFTEGTVNWDQVGNSAVYGAIAGFASGAAGYAVGTGLNVRLYDANIKSPLLQSMIVSPLAAGAGHIAAGTAIGVYNGKSFDQAVFDSFDGIGQSMAIGGAIGVASTVGVCYTSGVNPWNGKINKPLYHYTTTEAANTIEQTQLGFNEDSWVYLNPDGTKSPIQAQIDLALPQQNTGNALLEIKPNTLYPEQFIFQRNVTGNVYNRGGGGYEMIYKGTIPSKFILRLK